MPEYDLLRRVKAFENEVHILLSKHETSKSRVYDLTATYRQLAGLSLNQDDLCRQALRCAEQELYRAAHVMVWAALMDFLESKLALDGLRKLHTNYPNLAKHKSIEDLRENISEHSLIEISRKLKLLGKTQSKALLGLLNKRNECAHPSSYYPGFNETLGYISEIFNRMGQLQKVKYP